MSVLELMVGSRDWGSSRTGAQAVAPTDSRLPRIDPQALSTIESMSPGLDSGFGQVDAGLRTWVNRLRARGVSWSRIGEALGVTRRSAWEKFADQD